MTSVPAERPIHSACVHKDTENDRSECKDGVESSGQHQHVLVYAGL